MKLTVGLVGLGLLAMPLAVEAQPAKLARIGYLGVSPSAVIDQPFRDGLRELGWVEGRNVAIEYRWTEGRAQRLPELVAELVGLKVDVIYTPGSSAAAQAAKRRPRPYRSSLCHPSIPWSWASSRACRGRAAM
ncbi:MAG TPA: hypothetical protein VGX21_06840 [Methylomirabilota bacterium]|nr:hypothetical protein [Methylomirabilota bacterium]